MEFTEKNLFNPGKNSFVEDVLALHGVNPEMFLNGKDHEDEITSKPSLYFNMFKAANLVRKHIGTNSSIGILVDDDADGMTSAAAMARVLFKRGHHGAKFIFHDEKGHGLHGEVEKIIEQKIDFLIVPDAGSNDFKEQEEILEAGIDLLILDHHGVDNEKPILELEALYSGYALVNNQLSYNTKGVNKQLVGAGMVYKFAQTLDAEFETDKFSKDIIDLVAVGQIGDASDVSDLEIQLIIREGLDNLKNPLLVEALRNRIVKGQKIAPINMSFDIIPYINAVTRVGKMDEKIELMKGLIGFWPADETVIIQKRRKNKLTNKFEIREEPWTHYGILMDNLSKIKNRQNKEIDKVLKKIEDPYNENIVIAALNEDEIEYRSITGLIANKLVSQYNKPALVLISEEKGTKFSGSARGHEKTVSSFRQWCLSTELFELAQGHDNAFGVIIDELKLEELMQNSTLETEVNQVTYEVNKIYENETNIEEIKMINDNAWIFGGSMAAPKFGYKNLVIGRNCVSQRGSVVTFFDHGLEFIMYKQPAGLVDSFLEKMGFEQKLVVNLVGHASRNEWNGRVKEQVVLDDFEMMTLAESGIEDKEPAFDPNFDDDGNLVF